MQGGGGGLGLSKHRKAQRHKWPRSRYVYEHAAKLLNAEADERARRRARPLPYRSVIEAVEAAGQNRR
jgi:hypothetical protein